MTGRKSSSAVVGRGFGFDEEAEKESRNRQRVPLSSVRGRMHPARRDDRGGMDPLTRDFLEACEVL